MQSFQHIKNVYFLGIGGIGMSALARYFKASGKNVSGYDKTATSLTDELMAEGINVTFDESVKSLPDFISAAPPDETIIIYTPAIPADHRQFKYLVENGFTLNKRSTVLGQITQGSFTVAVAGTHGKTTTSAIITHILKSAGFNCTAFLGGISVNYHSNFIKGNPSGKEHIIIAEADEFDRSFLTLNPDIAVITSMDADHLDIYKDKEHLEESYRLFARRVRENGTLVLKSGLTADSAGKTISYSINEPADYRATSISVQNHEYIYSMITPSGEFNDWTLGMPGRHNVENAVAAAAVAMRMGVAPSVIRDALASFRGVKRRFEYHIKRNDCTYIDDYAHHPAELRAAISSVRELYSDKKITGIFQPHLYSRTQDFAEEFADSLSLLDALLMLDIYPARELPIPGVTAGLILDKVRLNEKELCTREELLSILSKHKPEVLLTLGAGDIDQLIEPIKQLLS